MKRAQKFDAAAAVIAVCAFTAMDSASSPAQEQVIAALHLSAVQYAWVSAAQFLIIAISAPLIGRCGDVFDKRNVLAISLGLACLGGLLAWSANSVVSYMLTQTLLCSWVGAQTVAMALLAELSPPDRKASAQGMFQGAVGFCASAALLAVGPIMAALGTLSLYWLPALLALPGALVLGRRLVRPATAAPRGRAGGAQPLDVRGALVLGGMLALLAIALQFVSGGGWMTALALASLGVMSLILPRWIREEKRHASPFVDVALLARRDVACIHLMSLTLGVGTTAIYVLLPMLITATSPAGAGYGSSALVVGGLLLPTGLTSVLLMPLYAPLDRRLGPRRVLALGLALMAIALMIPVLWARNIWPLLACTTLFGAGISLAYTEGITELFRLVPAERSAGASGTFQLAKTIGALLGATGFSVVLGSGNDAGAVAGLPQLSTAFGIAAGAALVGLCATFFVGPVGESPAALGDNRLVPRQLED